MKLLICIAACAATGWIGSLFTMPNLRPWYANLAKPSWTPPEWLFGPVWSALYLMMAVAAWLVWRRAGLASAPMWLFVFQLLLNGIWSGIFFKLRWIGPAFAEIAMLWISILATCISFNRVSSAAAWLLVPYFIWVTYASGLNFSIWRLNSQHQSTELS
jgi:tryptophan-rich sensory protein